MTALAELVAVGLPSSRRSEGPTRTVGDLLDQWMEWVRGRPDLRPKTIDHYEKAARHIVAWHREVLIREFDLDAADQYHRGRAAERASPRLLAQEFLIFRMAWKWGIKRGKIPARDFPEIKIKVDQNEYVINHHTPRGEDVAAVLEHLSGEWALALLLLATTGARVGEVCLLRRSDLDTRSGLLTLGYHEGARKTGRRAFPLPEWVIDKVSERADGSEAPLLDLRVSNPKEALGSRLLRACKHAKVQPFTPHGLRRMVVTQLIDNGVDPKTASSLTGHSVVVMLRLYQQATDDGRRAAVAKAGLGELRKKGKVIAGPWKVASGDDEA